MRSEEAAGRSGNVFLIVYGHLRPGGIETLIIRISHYLRDEGHRIIVCARGGEMLRHLQGIEIVQYATGTELARLLEPMLDGERQLCTILSFDPISCGRAMALEPLSELSGVHLSGVFHPRAYFMEGERWDRRLLNSLLARVHGLERLYFMNRECRDSHRRLLGNSILQSPIIPLPISPRTAAWRPRENQPLRVVSVGRLVPFKTYNLGLFDMARQILDRGVQLHWDVYGDGPLMPVMEEKMASMGLGGVVALKGVLDYGRFDETVLQYDLFVGMGTAVIEAANLGVPSICAIVGDPEHTYGYVHHLPFGNVGEEQPSVPATSITDMICHFAGLSSDERLGISRAGVSATAAYTLPHFVDALQTLRSACRRPSRFRRVARRLMAAAYGMLLDSSWANRIRKLRKDGALGKAIR